MKEIMEEWGECVLYIIYGLIVIGAIVLFMKYANGSWADNIIVKAIINGTKAIGGKGL